MGSIGEPHGKTARKRDRGIECEERVVKRPSFKAVSMRAQTPSIPSEVSWDHFIGQGAQMGWRAG